MSWFGTSLITPWFLQCPRMAANHQQSITRAPCHWGLCQPRWVSLGFCASFQLCEKPVLELGREEAGGIQPCPTVAKQHLSPHYRRPGVWGPPSRAAFPSNPAKTRCTPSIDASVSTQPAGGFPSGNAEFPSKGHSLLPVWVDI